MTLGSRILRVSYAGNGVTTDFSYTDRWFGLKVLLSDNTTLDVVEQVWGVDYTLDSESGDIGAIITFMTPPPADQTVIIISETSKTQPTNYEPNSSFSAASHETALDRNVAMIQEQNDVNSRNLKLHEGYIGEFDLNIKPNASSLLQVNPTGDAIIAVPLIEDVFTGDMLSNKIFNLADGVDDGDAPNMGQLNTVEASKANIDGSTPFTGAVDMAEGFTLDGGVNIITGGGGFLSQPKLPSFSMGKAYVANYVAFNDILKNGVILRNEGGHFNNVTGVYTAGADQWVLFCGLIYFYMPNDSSVGGFSFKKNGVAHYSASAPKGTTEPLALGRSFASTSVPIFLNQGDEVALSIYTLGGAGLFGDSIKSHFSGIVLG